MKFTKGSREGREEAKGEEGIYMKAKMRSSELQAQLHRLAALGVYDVDIFDIPEADVANWRYAKRGGKKQLPSSSCLCGFAALRETIFLTVLTGILVHTKPQWSETRQDT